jgi:hypothetical protein
LAEKPWELLGFMAAVKEWMERDEPPGDLLVRVAGFGADLEREPEAGAEREYANLYFRTIPGTEHDGWIVSISFSLHRPRAERFAGEVRCQSVVCVRHPQTEIPVVYPPPRHHRPPTG